VGIDAIIPKAVQQTAILEMLREARNRIARKTEPKDLRRGIAVQVDIAISRPWLRSIL
jgi:hypothetical protein